MQLLQTFLMFCFQLDYNTICLIFQHFEQIVQFRLHANVCNPLRHHCVDFAVFLCNYEKELYCKKHAFISKACF